MPRTIWIISYAVFCRKFNKNICLKQFKGKGTLKLPDDLKEDPTKRIKMPNNFEEINTLTNIKVTLQKRMDTVFKDAMFSFVLVYLDDIIVYSNTTWGTCKYSDGVDICNLIKVKFKIFKAKIIILVK